MRANHEIPPAEQVRFIETLGWHDECHLCSHEKLSIDNTRGCNNVESPRVFDERSTSIRKKFQ